MQSAFNVNARQFSVANIRSCYTTLLQLINTLYFNKTAHNLKRRVGGRWCLYLSHFYTKGFQDIPSCLRPWCPDISCCSRLERSRFVEAGSSAAGERSWSLSVPGIGNPSSGSTPAGGSYKRQNITVDASICCLVEPSLRSLFMKPIYKRNRRVYYQNVVIDFVYKVLLLNLTNNQLYKPTNVRSNVKRSTFQYDHCSNVGGSNPMRSNVSNQCEFPMGRSNQWEVPMQWTNEYQANG